MVKVFFLFIIAIGFFWAQASEAAGWLAYPSVTSYNFEGVDFYESDTASFGVIVGGGGKIAVSTDGGANWTFKSSGVSNNLYDVEIVGQTTAWVVGSSGKILKTTDGGTTWTPKASGVSVNLYAIRFFSSSVGYIVGAGGAVLYTADGGSSWTIKSSGSAFDLFAVNYFNNGLFGAVWAVSTGGIVIYSGSNGDSWVAMLTDAASKLSDLIFDTSSSYNPILGWVSSLDTILSVGDGGVVVKSTDGGSNWTQISSGTTANLNAAQFGSGNDVWAVGANGTILKSSDSGSTWTQESSGTTIQLNDVVVLTKSPLRVYAVGAGGKIFRYDDTPPAVPSNLTKTTADTNDTPTFTWSAANDQTTPFISSAVSKYEYSIDGGAYVDNGSGLTVTLVGALSGGSHTIDVRAVDSANNVSIAASLSFSISIPDTVAPTVGAISPATAVVNQAQSFTASYSDNVGVTSCGLFVNNIPQEGAMSLSGTTSGTATKSYTFSSAGSYAVKVNCTDGANTTWGAATTVVVSAAGGSDTTPPTGSVTINSGAAYTNSNSASLTLSCTDNVACTRMIVAVDGTVDTESMESFSTSKTISLSSGDGTKTVAVKFKDSATNASAQYTDTIILDTTAQDTVITTKPASNNLGLGDFYFGYTGSSITPVTFECRLDTGVFSSCESPKSYSNLSVGNHTFYVRAVDAAGNVDATADSYTWSITSGPSDTTSPTVGAITPVTAQATVSQSFTASYSDVVGVVSCDLYVDSSNQGPMNLSGTTAGTASRAYTFTSTASHTLQARCSDAEGNTGLGSLTTVSVSAAPVNQTDTSAPSVPSSVKKVSDDSDKTPTFTWNSANDNTGVTSYVIQIDNGSLVDIGGSLTYTAGTLSDGSHTMKVFAKDAAGNSSPVATFIFDVKTVITDTPVSCSLTINGAYKLSGSPAVYYITDECNKRAFNKSNVFFTYFNSWSDVQLTTKTKLDKIPLDTLGFMPWGPKYDPKYGALVKIVTDPKVYLLLGGEKYWITEEEIFTGLKYSWNWVEDIDKKLLDKYITGSEINYTDHHPNYTLVKYATSSKVYRLEPDPADSDKQVKRHIKNEKVFNALNFRWDRIVTISKTEVYKDGAELSEDDV